MSRGVVCTPLRVEQAALRGALSAADVLHTGRGGRTTRATPLLPDADADAGVVVAGVCGALDASLRPGDVVVATETRDADGHTVECPSWPLLAGALRRGGLTVRTGPVLTTARLVRHRDRARLAATGAVAVDMESARLAGSAAGPIAVVRAVADAVGAPLVSPAGVRAGWRALRALRRAAPALDEWAAALGARRVLLASPRSFCAGVERAIEIVERSLERFAPPVYVRKQIVHNAHVVADLEARGAVFVDELDDVPPGGTVVFSAHGVSPQVRGEARDRRLEVIDATCPLVAKVHTEARRATRDGGTVLLIGHQGHEEVEGTSGEAPGRVVVVDGATAARTVTVDDPGRVSYLMQTTLAVDEAAAIADVLRRRFPGIEGPRSDDICYATTNRQDAVRAIAEGSDVVLVVGSGNSSNSLRLVEVAERCGVRAHLVDDVSQIDLRWLAGAAAVGVIAGTSAPPRLVDDVIHALSGLGPVSVGETRVATENVRFTMPKEVS